MAAERTALDFLAEQDQGVGLRAVARHCGLALRETTALLRPALESGRVLAEHVADNRGSRWLYTLAEKQANDREEHTSASH